MTLKNLSNKLKKDYGGLNLYFIISFFLICFILILIGTFKDLEIDQFLYRPGNFYADFFEYTGTLPASIIIASSGVLIYYYLQEIKFDKIIYLDKIILVFLTLAIGFLWGYDAFHRHIDNLFISAIIGIIVISFTNAIFFKILKNAENKKSFLKKALLLIICGIITFSLTFILKGAFYRPRYMGIMLYLNGDTSYFYPWYKFSNSIGPDLIYIKENISSYYLESWPSGHSSFSSLLFLGMVYYDIKGDKEKNKVKLFSLFLTLMLLIGLSRITDGHHYLSDVGFGYLIGLLPLSCGFLIAYKDKKKNNDKNK